MTTHTPYELTHTLFSASKHEIDQQTVRIRGQYLSRASTLYDGYYYDHVVDEVEGYSLVMKVPKALRPKLKSGMVYELEGRVERRLVRNKELSIHLYFTLLRIIGDRPPMIDSRAQEKANILHARFSKPRHDIDLLFRNLLERHKRPLIAMVFGKGAATEADIMYAVGNRQDRYEFAKFAINLSDKTAIITKLQELDKKRDYDLMVLYRGGGSGLEIFDDPDIARAVVDIKTPFVTAIGHATDAPFIQDVVDRYFTTPTDFGKYLKEVADKYIREASQLKKYREREDEYRRTIANLRADKDRFQDEILQMSHVQQEQIPAQIATAFRRHLIVWLLAAIACGAAIGIAASYAYMRLLPQGTTTPPGAREPSVSNEQTPSTSVSPSATNSSQNVDRKRRGGR